MSRSLKKGPFIDPKLEAKIVALTEGNKKAVVKTWSRASMISPDFVGQSGLLLIGLDDCPPFIRATVAQSDIGEIVQHHGTKQHSHHHRICAMSAKHSDKRQ